MKMKRVNRAWWCHSADHKSYLPSDLVKSSVLNVRANMVITVKYSDIQTQNLQNWKMDKKRTESCKKRWFSL